MEHRGKRYADILSQTTQHQLGDHLSYCLDGNVFYKIGKWLRKHPHTVAWRYRDFGIVWHHFDARCNSHFRENQSVFRPITACSHLLMLAKTGGAIVFGVINAFIPIILAAFLVDLSGIAWVALLPAILLIAISSSFMGLLIAVSVSQVFEAQTLSNFFRFPMIFLCGLFFPLAALPVFLRPLSYLLPLTYGTDILNGAILGQNTLPIVLDIVIIAFFCLILFFASLRNIHRKWII